MGRDQLIAYCERLRRVLLDAHPTDWAWLNDQEQAEAWEKEASAALESHSTLGS